MELAIAVVSAVVAVVSALVSAVYARQSHQLAQQAARDDYLERVRDWADATVEVVVAVGHLSDDPRDAADVLEDRLLVRRQLSAQIEKGRWFFPNVLGDRVGGGKEPAYRGHRQPVLDALVAVYEATSAPGWLAGDASGADVVRAQRTFVSEVQKKLDPKRRDTEYAKFETLYAELGPMMAGDVKP